jgi:hypothetical protein
MKQSVARIGKVRLKHAPFTLLGNPSAEVATHFRRHADFIEGEWANHMRGYAMIVWDRSASWTTAWRLSSDNHPVSIGLMPSFVHDCLLREIAKKDRDD